MHESDKKILILQVVNALTSPEEIQHDGSVKPALYQIRDEQTGEYYLGSTKDRISRKGQHLRDLKKNVHPNIRLQEAYNHGHDLVWTEIPVTNATTATQFEKVLIEECRSDPKCMNMRGVVVHSEEHRRNLSLAHLGKKLSQETKDKLRNIKLGTKHSDETRAKMSASGKGRVLSEEHKRKIGEANRKKIT